MQHMQDVLLPFFSNNIFSSFCNAGNIKPGFKAIKTKQGKKQLTKIIKNNSYEVSILLLSGD